MTPPTPPARRGCSVSPPELTDEDLGQTLGYATRRPLDEVCPRPSLAQPRPTVDADPKAAYAMAYVKGGAS